MSDQLSTHTEQDTREPALWRQPAFLIILIAGLFHLGRGAPVDGTVFLVLAAALVLTHRWHPRAVAPPTTRPNPYAVLGVVLCSAVYGWVVGHWTPNTTPVRILVALPGLAVVPFAWRVVDADRRLPSRRWWWAVVGVLICLWELTSFLFQPDAAVGVYAHPTLSVILDPLFATPVLRSLLIALWLVAGAGLLRLLRGRR